MAASGGPSTEREISGVVTAPFVWYVQRAVGDEAAARVAGVIGRTPGEILSTDWYTTDETLAVIDAASAEVVDDDIGRRAGEALFQSFVDSGLAEIFVSLGSPQAALSFLIEHASRVSMARPFTLIESGDDQFVFQAQYIDPTNAQRSMCSHPAGMYGLIPSLFGFAGTAAEVACQLRGDDACRYVVRWQPDTRPDHRTDAELAASRVEDSMNAYEALRDEAAELAQIDEPSDALARIAERGSYAVMAPRFLLRASLHEGEGEQVHAVGFPAGDDVTSIAERVFAGELDVDGHDALVVALDSPRRCFGHLAALFPSGRTFSDLDRRLFGAYAGHAAAALDSIAALDLARRARDTSDALLDLARELAAVVSSVETTERLAKAMTAVLCCRSASVWLADEEGFSLVAVAGDTGAAPSLLGARLGGNDLPLLAAASITGRPVVLGPDLAPSSLRVPLGGDVVDRLAISPIAVRGEVLGIAVAGFSDVVLTERSLCERISALTDHAATALDNARLLERVHHDALHDALTGLPNRTLIEDRVKGALASALRTDSWPSLLFIDLDRFKNVNDTLGHGAGDELIRQVGGRLRDQLRDADTLGRLGGDEFVVLVQSGSDPAVLAAKVGEVLRAPFDLSGREVFISCSIGVAAAPGDGITYEELLQHADAAMYDAKDRGRATFSTSAPPRSEPRRDRLDLESMLHRAVENRELAVLFQPQVDLRTDQVIGAEALVRWDHPNLGRLAPDRFLRVAEESGLILDIDRYVRAEAFRQTRGWHDAGFDLRIAVNLSTRDLQHASVADDIAVEVAAAGLAAASVEVEVTDRVVMGDDTLPALVSRLREVGFRVAIDDFGTGTSVLGRLRSCLVDTLKIDRSFVGEIGSTEGDTIVRALVSLGHSLDLDVVAEGIETSEQRDLLQRLGCRLGQGYLLSRPVTAEAVLRLAAGRRATLTAAG